MKQKINILINEDRKLGLYYGFGIGSLYFQEELSEHNIEVNFFSSMNEKFLMLITCS